MKSSANEGQHPAQVSISAVIPTYNRGHLITRPIESILHQTFRPKEIIVVDDGSTDDTQKHVEAFGERVTYIRQNNAGASAARNRGLNETTAEWVAFLDSDDVWVDTHLERIAQAIAKTGGKASFYFADMERPKESGGGSHWQHCGFSIENDYEFTKDASDWVMLPWQPMMLQNSAFNREKYVLAGGLMERLRTRHDNHIFLKLGLGGPACAIAGYGTKQTYDADPVNHLMSAWGSHTTDFWKNTTILYEDILKTVSTVHNRHRNIMRERLAQAYWRLARFDWRNSNVPGFLHYFLKCVSAYPSYPILILRKTQK